LSYAEFGRPEGDPVLYFHGSPSSRLEPLLLGDEMLGRLGLRVISPDRPGMGGSDFQPGRRITDWPADVTSLADAPGLDRFAVRGARDPRGRPVRRGLRGGHPGPAADGRYRLGRRADGLARGAGGPAVAEPDHDAPGPPRSVSPAPDAGHDGRRCPGRAGEGV